LANGVWAYVNNEQGIPQPVGVGFRASWVGRVINYNQQGHPGWYWVETYPNLDLTCCVVGNPPTRLCNTYNVDNLLVPEGGTPSRYITFTLPVVTAPGW
jgi:hypothetical protein